MPMPIFYVFDILLLQRNFDRSTSSILPESLPCCPLSSLPLCRPCKDPLFLRLGIFAGSMAVFKAIAHARTHARSLSERSWLDRPTERPAGRLFSCCRRRSRNMSQACKPAIAGQGQARPSQSAQEYRKKGNVGKRPLLPSRARERRSWQNCKRKVCGRLSVFLLFSG